MAKYGADATLVNAAYKASMANAPKDVSKILENQLRSYQYTMAQINNSWSNVMRMGGKLLGMAAAGLKKRTERRAFGSTVKDEFGNAFLMDGSEFTKTINNDKFNDQLPEVEYDPSDPTGNWRSRAEVTEVMGLKDISKAYRETFKENPFSPESIAERMELNQKKQRIYTQIDQLRAGYGNLEQIFANEGYSKNAIASNYGDSRFLAAIAGESEFGDKIVKGHDANGNIILKLFNKNNDPILQDMSQPMSQDNKQLTVRADELGSLIIAKDPAVLQAMNQSFESLRAQGASGAKGVSWETVQGKYKNELDNVVGTENQLHYAMHEDGFFNFTSSFVDDLTSQSFTSANLYGSLGRKVPVDKNGNPAIDISKGSDPDAFDAEDFATPGNYAKIIQALTNRKSRFYNEDATRDVFKEWAAQKGSDVFTYGTTQRKEINPWGNNSQMRQMFFPPNQTFKGGIMGSQLNNVVSRFMQGSVPSPDGSVWNVDKKTQSWTNNVNGKTMSGDEMIKLHQQMLTGDKEDVFDLISDARFQRFKGVEGGSSTQETATDLSSNQIGIIKSMFGREGDEDIAYENITKILNGFGEKGKEVKKKFRIPVRPGQDKIELDGVEYNLKTMGEADKFIAELMKMIGGVEGVKSVGDQADELLSKYGS
tara:strand:+ start:4634 stop:6589 length:1956 start_codon:yes stop_codon:yes gene_type:complete